MSALVRAGNGAARAAPAEMRLRAGDVLHLTRAASVQFHRPIMFRLIRVKDDWTTFDGWVWLDGYQLDTKGNAVARRSVFVQWAGLRVVPQPRPAHPERATHSERATRSERDARPERAAVPAELASAALAPALMSGDAVGLSPIRRCPANGIPRYRRRGVDHRGGGGRLR
ncbi:hypothetical protein GCM10017556_29130 [Micromonospora sagamiensis]|uniref:Uncharacterized protein n=1 Tax=Micromonospora sagamiensis TaxID=47875 RepID=A0A562WNP6_9ACTN|nr:hypothetical protein JD81_05333 [Micromonospora sagamiensis]BCL15174.1 hypothetical protein GCM10017556_29130 [Micromonospora sagamiensis]